MPSATTKTADPPYDNTPSQDGATLHKRSPDLHKSADVQAVVSYLKGAGARLPNTPQAQLSAYLSFLAGQAQDGLLATDPDGLAWMVESHVVREQDVPESYFDLQRRVLREQGYGDVKLGAETRRQLAGALQDDQRAALRQWQQCLLEEGYPGWFTYYSGHKLRCS